MSFILDALRKSETERQQQTGPGLANVQYRSLRTGKSIWVPLLVIVLAINAAILAWVMNTDSLNSSQGVELSRPDATSASVKGGEIRSLSEEAIDDQYPVTEPVPVQNANSGWPDPDIQQLSTDPSFNSDSTETETIQDGLPSLQQLLLAGELSVLPMHLDIHVYSKATAERFIFINMKKYKQGENLAEGPSVEEITSTGAILSYQGKRFTLDRE